MKDISWFAKLLLIVLLVIFVVGLVRLSIKYFTPGLPAYSIQQVLENPNEVEGKRIAIYGLAYLNVEQTAVECIPDFCGCNSSFGRLFLAPDQKILSQPGSNWESIVEIEGYSCEGDQCTLECQPFEIEAGRYYAFVGTLDASDHLENPNAQINLINVDFDQTKQRTNIFWLPRLQ